MIQKIKGTMDILPSETPLWRYIENIMREEAISAFKMWEKSEDKVEY